MLQMSWCSAHLNQDRRDEWGAKNQPDKALLNVVFPYGKHNLVSIQLHLAWNFGTKTIRVDFLPATFSCSSSDHGYVLSGKSG
jgi:hypothetical protein